jgi:hypothetical protein
MPRGIHDKTDRPLNFFEIPRFDPWTPLYLQLKRFFDYPPKANLHRDDIFSSFTNCTQDQLWEAVTIMNDAYGYYICEVCFAVISHQTAHYGDCPHDFGDEIDEAVSFFPELAPVPPAIPVAGIDPNLQVVPGKPNIVRPPAMLARMKQASA